MSPLHRPRVQPSKSSSSRSGRSARWSAAAAAWTRSFIWSAAASPAHRPYLAEVERAARGLPVHIHANAPGALVEGLFATSAVFWVATTA